MKIPIISLGSNAAVPMLVRAASVGANFAVMMGLAAYLGLEAFGALAVLWGVALVVAPILSWGGPLLLLRALTAGGVSPTGLLLHLVTLPAGAAVAGLLLCPIIWPPLPWVAIILAAFAINFLTGLASMMRAMGSVNLSMVLRDCGPQLGLGIAAMTADHVLIGAMVWMGLFALLGLVWTGTRPAAGKIINAAHKTPAISASLWGTSVLGVGLAQVDIILGGALLSPAQIGIYVVLRRVANLVALPVSVATWVSANAVSKTHAQGDFAGLSSASQLGSKVALLPGMALFCVGVLALPFLPSGAPAIFAVLLAGAALQVVFASGFTVATLCGMARFAVMARAASLLIYLACAGGVSDPFENALAYVAAITCGSALLWWLVWRRAGVDTSAFALGAKWRFS
ncbi:hypothetical protein SAMN04488005_2048 [Yoonia tamlensis]|uniref:Membrane protein involved in the export of O-antigen and teichoic acid n=1 Tax=Yoonia tamlensis TaxID=390270 RepID=A0A1I6GR35_9RHOB|nr:hypothetical protein [Yoonia tamlensis]SFR44586.1 hypothetical protein SAMN04488005_2048 [Yoonia tamlensis]